MTKEELNSRIAVLIKINPPPMSTGSTESKRLFKAINEQLGLGLSESLTKPDMARAICEISGITWDPSCESRGSTVTKEGLRRVEQAVILLVGR